MYHCFRTIIFAAIVSSFLILAGCAVHNEAAVVPQTISQAASEPIGDYPPPEEESVSRQPAQATHEASPAARVEKRTEAPALAAEAEPEQPGEATFQKKEKAVAGAHLQETQKTYRPNVSWKPAFSLKEIHIETGKDELPKMTVGANIESRAGKVSLKEAVKALADLKGMNISWASDVDQEIPADVSVKADDDFWTALSNVLRQLDYYFEFKDNTIIVKYRETKRYYLPVPFLAGNFKSSVGGDMLGTSGEVQGKLKGTISVERGDPSIDLWANVETNLDKILKVATIQVPVSRAKALANSGNKKGATEARAAVRVRGREGFFFTIDKPLGIVTVTAPRSLQVQVEAYLNALSKELSRQVIIEAKIIEVRLNRNNQRGIDWSNLLKDSAFSATVVFGDNGVVHPSGGEDLISKLSINNKDFSVVLNALNEYGNVRVLSNPKLALMNGQPAMITVGERVDYIESVTSTLEADTDTLTFTIDTNSIVSGLSFGVVANISSDDEVILQLTPVVSQLREPIEYRQFGDETSTNEVGLPRVILRELTTMAKVKSGQFLIVGGLIDDTKGKEENKVPILGDVPLVGQAFRNTREYTDKKELIILLKPHVVNI